MKRPAGVTVSAVVLGFFAAINLLLALAMGVGAAFAGKHPASSMQNPALAVNPNPPAPGLVVGLLLVMAIFFVAVAVWQVLTLIGLLRLRSWARYSVLVNGGILAFIGISAGAMIALFATVIPLPATQTTPQVPPHTMQIFLLAYALFYLAIGAVGICWLVYFNRAAVKLAFQPALAASPNPYINPAVYGGAVLPGMPPPPPTPYAYPPAPTGRFSQVPTAVTIIACLFGLGAVCCLALAFIPVPAYLCGFILQGAAPHILYAVFAALAGLICWGLLRLDDRARLAVYGFTVFGAVNFLVLLTPWGKAQYAAYNAILYARMYHAGMALSPDPPPFTLGFVLVGAIFSLFLYGVQIWFLERHKQAFQPKLVA